MRTDRYATFGSIIGGGTTFVMGYTATPGIILGLVTGTLTAGLIVSPMIRKEEEKVRVTGFIKLARKAD